METTGLVEVANKRWTTEDQTSLATLLKSNANLEGLIPPDMPRKEWQQTTSVVCRQLARAAMMQDALMPVLGRLLVVAKQTPAIWEGHDTFAAFLQSEVKDKYAVGRSTAYEAMALAERFPEIGPAEYKVIGRRSVQVLLTAIPKGDESKPKAVELIEMAKTVETPKLIEACVKKKYLERGETHGAHVMFGCNKKQKKEIEDFFDDVELQAYLETSDRAKMLLRAIEEATTEWRSQIGDHAEHHKSNKKAVIDIPKAS